MNDSARAILLRCLTTVMLPVARFCLRRDIKLQDFVESAKFAFMEAAQEELRRLKQEANVTRLSVMTGIHRPDVRRLLKGRTQRKGPKAVPIRVLGQWQKDKRFKTAGGKPRSLSAEGENSEFVELVKSISRDVNPYSVLNELLRSGSVERVRGGKVRIVSRVFVPKGDMEQGFELLSRDTDDMLSAVEENILEPREKPNLHISTEYDNVSPKHEAEIRAWLIREGSAFHEKARNFLSSFDKDVSVARSSELGQMRVAVCAFSRVDHTASTEEGEIDVSH